MSSNSSTIKQQFGHYYKDVRHLDGIDVYRILLLFNVTDPCIQHAIKKLLVAGGRGNKDISRDVSEAIVSLQRWQEMGHENLKKIIDERGLPQAATPGHP